MTLSKWHKKIYNAETGEETFIEFTAEEIAIAEADQAEFLAKVAVMNAEAEAKMAARAAILDRLGLTADELQVLLS